MNDHRILKLNILHLNREVNTNPLPHLIKRLDLLWSVLTQLIKEDRENAAFWIKHKARTIK